MTLDFTLSPTTSWLLTRRYLGDVFLISACVSSNCSKWDNKSPALLDKFFVIVDA